MHDTRRYGGDTLYYLFLQLCLPRRLPFSPWDLKTAWFYWDMISTLFCSPIKCMVQCVTITTDLFSFCHNQSWNILFLQRETLNPLNNYCRILAPLVLRNHSSTFCLYRFPYYLTFHINAVMYHIVFGPSFLSYNIVSRFMHIVPWANTSFFSIYLKYFICEYTTFHTCTCFLTDV